MHIVTPNSPSALNLIVFLLFPKQTYLEALMLTQELQETIQEKMVSTQEEGNGAPIQNMTTMF